MSGKTPKQTGRRKRLSSALAHSSGRVHDNQGATLRSFLLNAMPEADREQVENELLQNDDFFAHVVAYEQELLDAQASGVAPAVDAEEIERAYGRSPVRRQRARIAQSIRNAWGVPSAPAREPGAALDQQTAKELMDSNYAQLQRVATALMQRESSSNPLSANELLHATYARLSKVPGPHLKDRAHFIASVTAVMRRVLIDHAKARRESREQLPRDNAAFLGINVRSPDDVSAVDEALDDLSHTNPRQSRIVELRYFAGLSEEETASALKLSVRTVKRDAQLAMAWLRASISVKSS
jgi:RNA polymerase sigma-70 factor (ECF subfamily)